MATRPLSPAARRHLHDACLGWGIALLVLAASIASTWVSDPGSHPTSIGFTVTTLAVAVVLGVIGVRGRLAATRFNRRDDAFADALSHQLDQLRQHGREAAYGPGPGATEVTDAQVVEVERYFDQQTTGAVEGGMHQQLAFFGRSLDASYRGLGVGSLGGTLTGLSTLALGVSTTTRANLMGDSLFAVVEIPGTSGRWDTIRVLAPSIAAAATWLDDLLGVTAYGLGGPSTHAGATVIGWRPALVEAFRPVDVSYLSDRLTAQAAHAPEYRDPVLVRGSRVGRNAVLAAEVQLGSEPALQVMPLGFPALFGRAVGIAAAEADRALAPGGSVPGGSAPAVTYR